MISSTLLGCKAVIGLVKFRSEPGMLSHSGLFGSPTMPSPIFGTGGINNETKLTATPGSIGSFHPRPV
jgi:hypothetical protein